MGIALRLTTLQSQLAAFFLLPEQKMRGALCVLLAALAVQACAVSAVQEGELAATEAVLDAMFPGGEEDGTQAGDLGEGADVEEQAPAAGLAEDHSTESALDEIERVANTAPKVVSYKFEGKNEDDAVDHDLGESAGMDDAAGAAGDLFPPFLPLPPFLRVCRHCTSCDACVAKLLCCLVDTLLL